MSLSNLTAFSGITDYAPASPAYLNSKLSEVQVAITQMNSDGSAFGITRSGSTVSFTVGNAVVLQSIDSGGFGISVQAYGAPTGTDDTAAFISCLSACVASGKPMLVNPSVYTCGALVDVSSTKLMIYGASGSTIRSTASTWLRVRPTSGGKLGVVLRDLTFENSSNQSNASPMILLHGDSVVGGVTEIDFNNLSYRPENGVGDFIHLRSVFNGRLSNIYGQSCQSSRGIVLEAQDFNSGNLVFDTIELQGCPVPLQMGRLYNNANQELLNQNTVLNLKAARSTGQATFNWVTISGSHNTSCSTLSLPTADVTSINTGDWAVIANNAHFGDVIRIRSKTSASMVQLEQPIPVLLASGLSIAVGQFGLVAGQNTRGLHVFSQQAEQVGCGVFASGAQQVHIHNLNIGSGCRRGVICTNGAQNVSSWFPIYSKSETTAILMETMNLGNTLDNTTYEAAGYSSGAGPGSFLSDACASTFANRYYPKVKSIRTVASLNSTVLFDGEFAVSLHASGSSLAIKSGGTVWFPNSSLSTLG